MNEAAAYLTQQFDLAWKLTAYHLEGLTTEECLWQPAGRGPHVVRADDGNWRAEMPTREAYDIGPPSIAWVTWHIGYWWSMVIDHSFGAGQLRHDTVYWPGTADATRDWLKGLQAQWREILGGLTDATLGSPERTRWPFADRPFGDVVAWLNIELTKNAAEIGYARFLFASRDRG